jgi:hypothetical protein
VGFIRGHPSFCVCGEISVAAADRTKKHFKATKSHDTQLLIAPSHQKGVAIASPEGVPTVQNPKPSLRRNKKGDPKAASHNPYL